MTNWNQYFGKGKKKKYGNEKTQVDGRSFGSKLEASVYLVLKLREKAGELLILQAQDHVYLSDAEILYVPDFRCRDLTTLDDFWVEAKGFEAARWPTIKKLWKYYGPGRLEIWKGSHGAPFLAETITPRARKTEARR